MGHKKLLVILVRLFKEEDSSANTRLLDKPVVNSGTTENLLTAIHNGPRFAF